MTLSVVSYDDPNAELRAVAGAAASAGSNRNETQLTNGNRSIRHSRRKSETALGFLALDVSNGSVAAAHPPSTTHIVRRRSMEHNIEVMDDVDLYRLGSRANTIPPRAPTGDAITAPAPAAPAASSQKTTQTKTTVSFQAKASPPTVSTPVAKSNISSLPGTRADPLGAVDNSRKLLWNNYDDNDDDDDDEVGMFNMSITSLAHSEVLPTRSSILEGRNDPSFSAKSGNAFRSSRQAYRQSPMTPRVNISLDPPIYEKGTFADLEKGTKHKINEPGTCGKIARRLPLFHIFIFFATVAAFLVGQAFDFLHQSRRTQRYNILRSTILSEGDDIVSKRALDTSGTAQNRALNWIADWDAAHVPVHLGSNVLERYSLAVFYYSTIDQDSLNLDHSSSNKIKQNSRDGSQEELIAMNLGNWMSSEGICTWEGVKCHDSTTEKDQRSLEEDGSHDHHIHDNYHADNNHGVISITLLSLNLTGTIPPEISLLTELRTLNLAKNNIGGSIPSQIAKLGRLEDLRINENSLVGTLPKELNNMTSIKFLSLRSNQLTGDFFAGTRRWPKLEYLFLSKNRLGGAIDSTIGDWQAMKQLDLSANEFEGSIPKEIGQLVTLAKITLSDNKINGTIPVSIGKLRNLGYFNMHSNLLTGLIPPSIDNLSKLYHLNLRSNKLVGTIPSTLGNMNHLKEVYLYDNNLHGSMPQSICGLRDTSLSKLIVDCTGERPKVQCGCCSECES